MAMERVWCPYCHRSESCDNNGGILTCSATGRTFTIEMSNEDIKRMFG